MTAQAAHWGWPGGRIVAVDILRAIALAGMVVYHCVWDLHALGFSDLDPGAVAAVGWFGHVVAAAFLFLSGLSLRLAETNRQGRRTALARLAALALAAGSVTLATWIAVPEAAVRFGILHCLVVAGGIGLLLLPAPSWVVVLAAVGCLVLPLAWPWPLSPDWAWLGLSTAVPPALDFRPVLPWLAVVLIGLAAGRTALVPWLAGLRLGGPVATRIGAVGRHSLAIYLVHQPVLFGALLALSAATGTPRAAVLGREAAVDFLVACTRTCTQTGGDDAICRATCHCVLTATTTPTQAQFSLPHLAPADARIRRAVDACKPVGQPP